LDGVLLLLLKSKETMLVLLAFGISWMVIGAWLGVYLAWQTVGFHFFGLHHADCTMSVSCKSRFS
jgi:disulfide bond formation protein DsbB